MGHKETLNHLVSTCPISKSELDSDNEVFTIQTLLPYVSDSQKVFSEKNDTKESLVQKVIMTNLLLRKLTLTSLFLRTIRQH